MKKTTSYGIEKNVFTLHIPPLAPDTYDFVVRTFSNYPRKILLVVLQIGNRESQRLINTLTYIHTLPQVISYLQV
jgi:hypothetical protein